ncbi:scaffold protein Nfu/NifU N terminal-domain-containing protein [Cytidiella melzeri]|nr:scaffold protein Nfu/NifU N terminal-domain-containing protein [Cytidiella melzeri]
MSSSRYASLALRTLTKPSPPSCSSRNYAAPAVRRHLSYTTPRNARLLRKETLLTASTRHPHASTTQGKPMQYRSMFIQTETTPNDDSLKFIPGVSVMQDGSAEFLDTRSALKSPLAIRLMGIEGVKAVFYGPDFVTVSKDAETAWAVVKPEIYSILMEFFSSSLPLFRSDEDREAAGPQDTKILDTDSETVAMIKELLETRVRPAIMEDGGDIEYRGFTEEGIVEVKLKGSCRGCDSSTVTLKSGIERMLMHYIPEVKGVEQILDQEEQIANEEFQKLEQRLENRASQTQAQDSP